MKKNHVLLFTLVSVFALNSQTTANFTTAENYVDGPLEDSNNWDDLSSGFMLISQMKKFLLQSEALMLFGLNSSTNIG